MQHREVGFPALRMRAFRAIILRARERSSISGDNGDNAQNDIVRLSRFSSQSRDQFAAV